MRLDHVNIVVTDMERSLAFYVALLGMQVTFEAELTGDWIEEVSGLPDVSARCVFCLPPGGGARFELLQYRTPPGAALAAEAVANTLGLRHVALEVNDLDALYAHMTAAGVPFTSKPVWVPFPVAGVRKRLCYARDPDGAIIELAEYVPAEHAPDRFLGPEATTAQITQATTANHQVWMASEALKGGGELRHTDGIDWNYTPGGRADLPFPRLAEATTGETLDAILTDCRSLGVREVSCWAVTPTRPRDLGARLAARGFEWGWKPHWMALDLERIPDVPVPKDLRIALDSAADWAVDDLPLYTRPSNRLEQNDGQTKADDAPRHFWHFGAWLDGKVVGHCVLHVTFGRLGVAGIYSVGVVPSARRRGIGGALTLAACRHAQALGCCWATLNAATDIYTRLGFVSLGWGQTWWMHAPALAAPPPPASEVAFAEAVGRGDVETLDGLHLRGETPSDLDAPLLSGMTPMEMAIRPRRPTSARWLAAHGSTLEIIHAWDLGWKARVSEMLAKNPALADRRLGPWGLTPLHTATSRGDTELASLLLTAKPDTTIKDAQFGSTALGWARHLGQTKIATLLEAFDSAPPS